MKELGLFYFSGTGNTKLVTSLIAEEFAHLGWKTSIYNVENINSKDELPDMESFDLIGMGAQVIGFTTPRRMNQFIRILPDSKKSGRVFIYRTCGGVAKNNYAASHSIIHMLRKKKYNFFYERLFSIGSNWMYKFDDEIMQQLYVATARKIKLMCTELIEGKERFYETSACTRLKYNFIACLSKLLFPFMGKNMKVSKSCTKCECCIKNCPEKNINILKGKIHFASNCSACLRCIYDCPKQAINFRILTFMKLKDGYNLKKSLSSKIECNKEKTGNIPPFFERYIIDDNM